MEIFVMVVGTVGYVLMGGLVTGLMVRWMGPPRQVKPEHPTPDTALILAGIGWPATILYVTSLYVFVVASGEYDWKLRRKPKAEKDSSPVVTLSDRDYESVVESGNNPSAPTEQAIAAAKRFTEKHK